MKQNIGKKIQLFLLVFIFFISIFQLNYDLESPLMEDQPNIIEDDVLEHSSEEMSYAEVEKYIYSEHIEDYDISILEKGGSTDTIALDYRTTTIGLNNPTSAEVDAKELVFDGGGGNTNVKDAIDAVDGFYIGADVKYNGGWQYLQINYPSDTLTANQRKCLDSISIYYNVRVQNDGSIINPDSENLQLIIETSDGRTKYHQITNDIEDMKEYSGYVEFLQTHDITGSIRSCDDFISNIKLRLNVDEPWYNDLKLHIDKLMIYYDVKECFQTEVTYDFCFPYFNLQSITEFYIDIGYTSDTDCSINAVKDGNIYQLYEDSTGRDNYKLHQRIGYKDYFSIDGTEAIHLSLKFNVWENVLLSSTTTPSLIIDYVTFSYEENDIPELSIEDISDGDRLYCDSPPEFFATAMDWSGISRVVLNGEGDFNLEFNKITDDSYAIKNGFSEFESWEFKFNSLYEHSIYEFSITAYDIFDNENEISFSIVRDATVPSIASHMESLTDTPPEIKFEIFDAYLNRSTLQLEFNNGDQVYDFMLEFNYGTFYHLSSEDYDEFCTIWNNSDDVNMKFTVLASDYADNQGREVFWVQKDTSGPDLTILSPEDAHEYKTTPDIIIYPEDFCLNEQSLIVNVSIESEFVISELEFIYTTDIGMDLYGLNNSCQDYEQFDEFFKCAPIGRINLTFYAEDMFGHNITLESYIMKNDFTIPELILFSGDDDWHSDPAYVSAFASDYNLEKVYFTIDEDITEYLVNSSIPSAVWDSLTDGIHTIHVSAKDSASNIKTLQYTVKKDTTAPVIDSFLHEPGTAFNKAPFFAVNVSDIENLDDLTIYYEFSGVQGPRFWIQNNTITQLDSDVWENQISQGQVEIMINVTDQLGFSSQYFYSFIKDTFYPIVDMNTLNYTAFFEEIPVIQYSTNEHVTCEIYYHEFRFDMNYWVDLVYEMHVFELKFIDIAGNTVNYTLYLDKQDSIKPVISIDYPFNGEEVGNIAPTFQIVATDATLSRLTYEINHQSLTIPFESNYNYEHTITFTIDQSVWDEAYNQTVDITIYAIDEFNNRCNITVTLVRTDYISEYTNEGLGLGLFMDMPIQMLIALGIAVVVTVGIQFIAYKKHRNVKVKIPEVQS